MNCIMRIKFYYNLHYGELYESLTEKKILYYLSIGIMRNIIIYETKF